MNKVLTICKQFVNNYFKWSDNRTKISL